MPFWTGEPAIRLEVDRHMFALLPLVPLGDLSPVESWPRIDRVGNCHGAAILLLGFAPCPSAHPTDYFRTISGNERTIEKITGDRRSSSVHLESVRHLDKPCLDWLLTAWAGLTVARAFGRLRRQVTFHWILFPLLLWAINSVIDPSVDVPSWRLSFGSADRILEMSLGFLSSPLTSEGKPLEMIAI